MNQILKGKMLTTVRPSIIKRLFATLKDVIVEATLHWQQDGVRIQELDITQQICLQVHLFHNECESYEHAPGATVVDNGEQVRINLVHFFQQFHSITKDDVLKLWVDGGTLYQKLSTPVRSRTHMLEIIPCAKTNLLVDQSGWDTRFSIGCTTFHSIIKELATSGSIHIKLNANLVTFSNETTIITHVITNDNITKPMRDYLGLATKQPTLYEGTFLSSNLAKIHRASHLADTITIHVCVGLPMILVYPLGLGVLRIAIQPS
jgi:hypothetical protein